LAIICHITGNINVFAGVLYNFAAYLYCAQETYLLQTGCMQWQDGGTDMINISLQVIGHVYSSLSLFHPVVISLC